MKKYLILLSLLFFATYVFRPYSFLWNILNEQVDAHRRSQFAAACSLGNEYAKNAGYPNLSVSHVLYYDSDDDKFCFTGYFLCYGLSEDAVSSTDYSGYDGYAIIDCSKPVEDCIVYSKFGEKAKSVSVKDCTFLFYREYYVKPCFESGEDWFEYRGYMQSDGYPRGFLSDLKQRFEKCTWRVFTDIYPDDLPIC